MVTWIRFRDKASGVEFYTFNTHFDHQVQEVRERSAGLVRRRVAALEPDVPVLLLGDFNAAVGAIGVHTILNGDGVFVDSWDVAGERGGEGMGTFNNFRSIIPDGPRIDWILVRGDMSVRHSLPTGGPVPQRPFPGCRPGAPDVPVNGTTRHGSG